MKNINTLAKILIPLILVVVLMSYGNVKNHRDINAFIVKSFESKNNKGEFSMPDFKKYTFRLSKVKLKGYYVSKGGYFNHPLLNDAIKQDKKVYDFIRKNMGSISEEKWSEKTPEKWIIHGGFSADEPEVPASLRHFYDPTRQEGERYLSNKINSKIMRELQTKLKNAKTDGIEWALGTKGNVSDTRHVYTWKYGKLSMKKALEEPDLSKRNKYMARAWRSLGETLHMIADNGCPAHVRNDGHPAFPGIDLLGDPDFYEEDMANRTLDEFRNGPVPKSLKTKFRKAKTTKDIAHQMAVFTNKSFFTTETISGTDWKGNKISQITHPDYKYKSPKLSAQIYDNNYYRVNIKEINKEVLLATDSWFFSKFPLSKTYPYLDEECVISQAKILIPSIIEAGVNVMKLFIPKLEIVITEVREDGFISGRITHLNEKDLEYKEKILYNGPVIIKNKGASKIGKFTAKNGLFSGKIKVEKETKATAEIAFGGIIVHSDQFTIKPKKKEEEEIDGIVDIDEEKTKSGYWILYNTKNINGCEFYESDCYPLNSCSGSAGNYSISVGSSTCGGEQGSGSSGSGSYTVPPSKLIPGESLTFTVTASGDGYTSVYVSYYEYFKKISFDKKGHNKGDSPNYSEKIVSCKKDSSPSQGTYKVPEDLYNKEKGALLIDVGGSIGTFDTSRRSLYLYKWQK